jgi:hypothetical protein
VCGSAGRRGGIAAALTSAAPTPRPSASCAAASLTAAAGDFARRSEVSPSVRRISRSLALVDDELADAFVWWDEITTEDVAAYRAVLSTADNERPLQKHLALHPILLVQHLGGGHGRWVLSQKRLGSEYVTDFIVGERSSTGFEWQFVELQSPRARLFVRSGRQSEQFDEGWRQIEEWRRWLEDNRDYARRPCSRNGLGLVDVSAGSPGLLLIGREADLTQQDRDRRRQLDKN